ncbi:hypothetical protein Tco_0102830 [Tanacetum coccineum]
MKVVQSSSHVSIVPSLSSSNHVFASSVSDRGNIIRRTASFSVISDLMAYCSFQEIHKCESERQHGQQPHGFIIHGIKIFKDNKKVMEVVDVENWRIDNSRVQHMFIMDDPNITMEEYIKLEEEKARRHGRTFNWQTATYVIVFDDTSDAALSCEPTVSPLDNNEIDFKISFDESDDEDYMVIFDQNSFSCKIISVDNLKTDSENENDKVNIPSSPSLEPTIGYIDDLDFFKDYENEFPTIAYNDLMSKSNPLIEASPSRSNVINIDTNGSDELLRTNHDKINKVFSENFFIITLNANIVDWNYLNSWMPLNLIKNLYVPFGIPFDPKRYYKDGADTRILRRPSIDKALGQTDMEPLPSRDQRYPWLRYYVKGYGEDIVHCYEQRLETIWGRMSDTEMGLDVADTLCFQLRGARRMMTWRQFILALGLHTKEEMVEAGFGAYWQGSERVIPDKRDLRDYWMEISSDKDFLGPTPSYVFIRDPVRRLCHRMIACSIIWHGGKTCNAKGGRIEAESYRVTFNFGRKCISVGTADEGDFKLILHHAGTSATATCPQDYTSEGI